MKSSNEAALIWAQLWPEVIMIMVCKILFMYCRCNSPILVKALSSEWGDLWVLLVLWLTVVCQHGAVLHTWCQQERLSCSWTLRCIQGLGYFLGILLVTAESVLFFERRRCQRGFLSCCPDDSPGGRELVNAEQKSDYRQLRLHLNNYSTIILSFILIHVNATH